MKKQNSKDVMRGDPREEIIYIPEDYSAHKISFGVKAGSLDNMLNLATADILIQKLNSAAGGDDAQITATYANGKTKITVKLEKDDTQDFTEEVYSYDITVQPADNSTEPETVAIGELAMIGDVQNDYSGSNLPGSGGRYITIDLVDYDEGDFLIVTSTDVKGAIYVCGEEMVGTKNGINTSFTFPDADVPATGKEQIFINGQALKRTVGYTISGGTVTMATPPQSDDYLTTNYWKIKP
jgi:hypothetical protein